MRMHGHSHGALWYRAFLIASMVVLTAVAWFVVGGQAGAMLWVVGFLVLWATKRVANRAFAGFFFGDDRAPEFGQ